ncbi:hypothetical protein FOA52_015991 [Chlamydomonas sp. UWO 241]|nr:hypothetical protein FOA52_015991 [Chlamydomonas sp. UWO 241]
MLRGAEILSIPVIVTEQYVKAFGPTVAELSSVYPSGTTVLPKTRFSMCTPEVEVVMKRLGKTQVVLVGVEAHVCVLQTTLDLLKNGYEVHLLVDGVSSSRPLERTVALKRMARAGAYLKS